MDEHLTKAQKKELRKEERKNWEDELKKHEANQKLKKFIYWCLGLAVAFAAIGGLIALVNNPSSSSTPNVSAPKISANDITTGPQNAKVQIIEYADFQCPACEYYYPFTKQLLSDFKGKILFVYRFFPLTQLHQNAMISAQAAYAGLQQGKFWEMHDLLFDHQKDWATVTDPTSIYLSYAKQLNLDINKFTTDMNSDAAKKFITGQEDAGTNAGVDSTPTFFINGKQIQNPPSYDGFKQLVEAAMK